MTPRHGKIEHMTHNWNVYGHEWAIEHLRRGLVNGRVRHAYLITGPESVGKRTLATAFAMALQCQNPDMAARPCGECRACKLIRSGNHPDLVASQLDGSTGALKIEEVRAVTSKIALKPFEGRYRIAILSDFERAQPRAQDALLKTLEEPPGAAIVMVLASSTDAILPTIISRCQSIALTLLPTHTVGSVLVEQFGADPGQASLLARLSGGRLGWAVHALQDPSMLEQRTQALDMLETLLSENRAGRFSQAEELAKDKLALVRLLELWQTFWRDVLMITEDTALPPVNADRVDSLKHLAQAMTPEDAMAALKATRETLANLAYNVNVRLTLEVMMLDYPGLKR
jgi:DNA polymerase-3 subunit delta'